MVDGVTGLRGPCDPGRVQVWVARVVRGLSAPRTRFALLLLLVAAALVLVSVVGVPDTDRVSGVTERAGAWAPVVGVLGIAVLALLVFPRAAVAAVAGLVYGPAPGTLYAVLGTTIGATVAFGVGRALGRAYLVQRLGARLGTVDRWLARRGFLAVLYARILPVVPFGLLNYGFGTTRVRPWVFVVGTAAGILPSTYLYATLGGALDDPTSPEFVVAAALTVAITVAGAVVVHRANQRRRAVGASHPTPGGGAAPGDTLL